MRQSNCPYEMKVLQAARLGKGEDGLATHLAECDVCKETFQTSLWMQALARSSQRPHALPDAGLLWWRVQFSENQAKVEKAQELLEWVEIISATVISAGLAGWIGWNWFAIQSALASLVTEPWPQLWTDTVSLVSTTPTMFSLSALIMSAVAIALGYPLLVRD